MKGGTRHDTAKPRGVTAGGVLFLLATATTTTTNTSRHGVSCVTRSPLRRGGEGSSLPSSRECDTWRMQDVGRRTSREEDVVDVVVTAGFRRTTSCGLLLSAHLVIIVA